MLQEQLSTLDFMSLGSLLVLTSRPGLVQVQQVLKIPCRGSPSEETPPEEGQYCRSRMSCVSKASPGDS